MKRGSHLAAACGVAVAAGLAASLPTRIVVGLITGTQGTKAQVESGEYNRKIDARIAEIKSTRSVQQGQGPWAGVFHNSIGAGRPRLPSVVEHSGAIRLT